MVSSVGGTTYSYLGQLQNGANRQNASSSGNGAAASTPAIASSNTTAQSLVSSLLTGSNGFVPEVLSLLQESGSGSFDPVTSLLGGTSTNNALAGLYSDLYSSAASASLSQAKAQSAATSAPASTGAKAVDNLIKAQNQSSIAYNQALQQNTAFAASADSYGADGVTKLVS